MAHYTIDLPGSLNLDIYKGKLIKMRTGFLNKWPWIKSRSEVRTEYFVTAEYILARNKRQYHFVKTKEGKWLSEAEHALNNTIRIQGKRQPLANNPITLVIKKATDEYENKQ